MAASPDYSRVHRFLSLMAGAVLVAAAFLLEANAQGDGAPRLLRVGLVVAGCAFTVLGVVARQQRLGAALGKTSLIVLSPALLLIVLEVIFRVAGFDFERLKQPGKDVPIYYRQPMLHAGEGIFRRPGPMSWRGRVLASYMRIHGTDDGPYADERPVEAHYDALGFRNPPDLTNWDVVVTGDSFVELGYLPYEELFTTLAAKRLGIRVRNLGVAGTGPISQTFYVKNYGKAASTKDAVLCFFEGNDLEDLSREIRNRESYRATGHPWERRPQTSLLKALDEQFRLRWRARDTGRARVTPNAVLTTTNPERPMTVCAMPPAWNRLGRKKQEAVAGALTNWAETVRSKGMRPWVMYLPDSHRVFHGFIRYAETNSAVALWTPGEIAPHLEAICTNLGVGFINTFPALRREAQAGRMPYNVIGDTHLSAEGTRVVADLLADALGSGRVR